MRRTRFAGAVETTGGNARASIREALWFDILSPDTPDNHSLSAWRVTAVDLCAIFLGLTHLVSAIGLLFLHPGPSLSPSLANPLLPLSLLLALDAAVIVALRWRDRIGLAPHTVIRCLAGYLAMCGGLWIVVGLMMTAALADVGQAFPILMICGGMAMAAMVSVNSPSLALANALVTTAGAFLLTN